MSEELSSHCVVVVVDGDVYTDSSTSMFTCSNNGLLFAPSLIAEAVEDFTLHLDKATRTCHSFHTTQFVNHKYHKHG